MAQDFHDRISALDIYMANDCIVAIDPSDVVTYAVFVRERKPAPRSAPGGCPELTVFIPGWLNDSPRIGVSVFQRDGKPVWRFDSGDEVHCLDDFIRELDSRLPQLAPKPGAS